jgi:hypothetical protein
MLLLLRRLLLLLLLRLRLLLLLRLRRRRGAELAEEGRSGRALAARWQGEQRRRCRLPVRGHRDGAAPARRRQRRQLLRRLRRLRLRRRQSRLRRLRRLRRLCRQRRLRLIGRLRLPLECTRRGMSQQPQLVHHL